MQAARQDDKNRIKLNEGRERRRKEEKQKEEKQSATGAAAGLCVIMSVVPTVRHVLIAQQPQ
jgi:hypothetical protein